MYILAPDYKARNLCGEFLAFIKQIFFRNKSDVYIFIFVYQKSLKPTFEIDFSVHNNLLNLCGQVENSKWLNFRCTNTYFLSFKQI